MNMTNPEVDELQQQVPLLDTDRWTAEDWKTELSDESRFVLRQQMVESTA